MRDENDDLRIRFECKEEKQYHGLLSQEQLNSISYRNSDSAENNSNEGEKEDKDKIFNEKYDREKYSACLRHILFGKTNLHEQSNMIGTRILDFNKSNKQNQ